MPNSTEKFYLTTPIYYVNARPHIGHAYTTIVADTVARRKRAAGIDTWFLTGTDEHGQKIERSAAAAGIPPQQLVDEVSPQFRALWDRMGLTYDDYIRTTEPRHERGVQHLFSTLYERGHIYLDTYTGQYSVGEEMFVDGPPGTIGPDGRPTETVTEENFYFRLSKFQRPLIDLIESGTLSIQNDARKNEVLSFLRGNVAAATEAGENTERSAAGVPYVPGALKDLSISRSSISWGIPVPSPAADQTTKKHVIYVWLDALVNYITAIGYGSDDPADQAKFARLWPADLHFVGKEIIRFHCVYWPAFLLAAGLPLPKAIVAHGWLLFEESKMSKSRGNIVRTETILEGFGALRPETAKTEQDLFGADVLRYFLLREIPFGQDGSFSFDALVQRYNSDLANGYGNLVSRTLAMIQQYFDGVIPQTDLSTDLTANVTEAISAYNAAFERYDFNTALASVWSLVAATDGFITANAPWKLAKDETQRDQLANVLRTAAKAIRVITALLHPILPYTTAQVWQQLGLGDIEAAAINGSLKNLQQGGINTGTTLGTLTPIFPRADKDTITRMTQMEQERSASTQATPQQSEAVQPLVPPTDVATTAPATPPPAEQAAAPAQEYITIDDFAKVELRVAQIKVAERIPKADKLLRLEVDLGDEQRQILSGIAEWYTPEDLIGRRIVVITNLAPRKMRGLESHGMLLAASHGENGKPVLATFSEEIALGARLR